MVPVGSEYVSPNRHSITQRWHKRCSACGLSKRGAFYCDYSGGERTIFGIAISVQAPGDPPDANDLWRLEQAIEEHVSALFGERSIVGAAIVVSSPDFGDAPEWLLDSASHASVRKFKAARSGVPVKTHDDDADWD